MSFFTPFKEPEKDLFRTASTVMGLPKGSYLLRRGEPGGDVYLIEEGALEVVDRRATPEVILAVLQAGAVVGEMAFLEDTPRSADVRAASESRIRRWGREDLRRLLEREPVLAARFFEAIARTASTRIRTLTTTAVAGGLGRGDGSARPGAERVREEALALADATKEALLRAETSLRGNPNDPQGAALVSSTLDALQNSVSELFSTITDPELGKEAARLLGRELHPYLVRASLADRCIRRDDGGVGAAEVLAHVLVDTATGDGLLGERIDRWLLQRETFVALRGVREAVIEPVASALPDHRNRRILVLNAGTGSLVAALGARVGAHPTTLTVVDPNREALAFLDAGVALRPRKVELRTIQESVVQVALSRSYESISAQDAVLVHGLLEYMPDRIAVSLLGQVRDRLAPDGVVVATALAPSPDATLLDRILRWPTVRRGPERLLRLFVRAGLEPQPGEPRDDALLVVAARAMV